MRKFELLSATALAMFAATPAMAQSAPAADAAEEDPSVIVVTAQRQAESLQSVPIAVSAFTAEALERQQIDNASDLQLTLPNVTFTKGNFTGSSFTIRGIGDLCVGTACDSATGIHINGSPLLGTRLFETEYFDLERIEVLRGPQGTLFGRNATSGVVNFISAKPDLTGFHASGEAEYGNFNSIKLKGMVNAALGDTLGIRIAGFYLNRDGYTTNIFNNTRVDDRNMYAFRGSIRWQPSDTTTVDLMGYYFREKDSRARIQKQQCQRDPTGVLGCLPNRRDFGVINGNATFTGVLTSREFFAVNGLPTAFALGSIYGPDVYATFNNPANVRQVNTDFTPEYYTSEQQYQARVDHDFGRVSLQVTGLYQKTQVESRQDYNLSVANRAVYAGGLASLSAAAGGLLGAGLQTYLKPIADALIPAGPNGTLCTSDTDLTGVGSFGGNKICAATPLDFDRSRTSGRSWSVEGILSSDLDGPFNFLLGGIYVNAKARDTDYYVNAFSIDYLAGILGSFTSLGGGAPPSYLGTPYFRNSTPNFSLKSYGIFGEAYYEFSDRAKLTLGVRYNNDEKALAARSTLVSFLVPYGRTTDIFGLPAAAGFDADPGRVGNQPFQVRNVKFSEWTGRAVFDFEVAPNHLLYASYSRGYKSGGINPPLQPVFAVPEGFGPETVNAFEIGSKNTFANGRFQLNVTGFYYQYKSLQLSRIVARTSVNDNVDAEIYGLEIESVIRPSRNMLVNMGFSYLHARVSTDKFLGNPRDPSGGRSDAVIIKDITNGSNCAVVPTTAGNAAGANGFVNAINPSLGLRPTTSFPSDSGLTATGAFSICSVLAGQAAGATGAAFGGIRVELAGVPVNINGNTLPQAPNYKFSAGAQYTIESESGFSVVPRADLTYTGDSYGNIFNGRVNKIPGYVQVNAQLQVNGRDDRWYVKGFIQNVFNNNATTGLYVTDQSSGLFTNIFTLEPRRYGITAGFKF